MFKKYSKRRFNLDLCDRGRGRGGMAYSRSWMSFESSPVLWVPFITPENTCPPPTSPLLLHYRNVLCILMFASVLWCHPTLWSQPLIWCGGCLCSNSLVKSQNITWKLEPGVLIEELGGCFGGVDPPYLGSAWLVTTTGLFRLTGPTGFMSTLYPYLLLPIRQGGASRPKKHSKKMLLDTCKQYQQLYLDKPDHQTKITSL